MPKLSSTRLVIATISLLVLGLSWLQIQWTHRQFTEIVFETDGVPMRVVQPLNVSEPRPGVIVAHGFSGSQQLMLGYGYALAEAGYIALLLDFPGHGTNANPLALTDEGGDLDTALRVAIDELEQLPNVSNDSITILGHSMGSGVVLREGMRTPQRFASVVAVSPTGTRGINGMGLNPTELPNLYMQAGQLEQPFVRNARRWLERLGGESADFSTNSARVFDIIPNVEHISILFSPRSHQLLIDRLNTIYNRPAQTLTPDTRMLWYLIQLPATLIGLTAMAPLWRDERESDLSVARPKLGLVAAVPIAFGATVGFGRLVELGGLGGVSVGGGLGFWLLAFGVGWLVVGGIRPRLPTITDFYHGLALFILLWFTFNAFAHYIWLPANLVPGRLLRVVPLALAFIPWLLAAATVQENLAWRGRLGWWLAQSALIFVGLVFTMGFTDGLGFLALILPLLPVMLGIIAVAGAAVRRSWPFALGNAIWFSLTLLSFFPLVS